MRLSFKPVRGFTIVELLVAALVVGVTFSALATAAVALQRSLHAVRDYSAALSAQTRIADYVRRDLRNCLDAAVLNGGARLRLDLPDDYDVEGDPVDPTITPDRKVTYGTPGARMQAFYYLDGANFIRETNAVKTVIAPNVADFQPSFSPVTEAGELRAVQLAVTYAGKFKRGAAEDAAARQATRLSTLMTLRNKADPLPPAATPPPANPNKKKRKGR